MQGKRVLVTGAGTGIGVGVATAFAQEGADVALHYSHSKQGATSLVDKLKKHGGRVNAFQADFNDIRQVRELGRQAVEFLEGIDILINNAGISMNMPFEKVTAEQFHTLYNVNVCGMFFLTQEVLGEMLKNGKGVVINFTSVQAYGALREHAVYAGTKGAIISYTRELAVELAPKGIRVNAIAPGWVRVANQEKAFGDDFDWEAAGRGLPAGYVADPEQIGDITVFLASDKARFIVGQTLVADGGQLAVLPCAGDFREPLTFQFGKGYVPGLD